MEYAIASANASAAEGQVVVRYFDRGSDYQLAEDGHQFPMGKHQLLKKLIADKFQYGTEERASVKFCEPEPLPEGAVAL